MAQKTIGSMPEGSIVKMNMDGRPKEFMIVHQGNPPNSDYVANKGTWLLIKDCYDERAWSDWADSYPHSNVHKQLNEEILSKFDLYIQKSIQSVHIPYCSSKSDGLKYYKGYNGLQTKLFLLSGMEIGYNPSDTNFLVYVGYHLNWFKQQKYPYPKNIALLNGLPTKWWLRDPVQNMPGYSYATNVDKNGSPDEERVERILGFRFAFVVRDTLVVGDDGTVITNTPPTTPTSINLPSTVKGGQSCSISWSAASDPDGNLEGYIVERSYNGGSSWAQIYRGRETNTSTTIPHGTSTVMFRVCAYDTDGAESEWRTSSNKIVLNNRAPSAPPAINVPVKPAGGSSITVTWSAANDSDGNLEGYRLERQWDGKGSWSQIYQGSNLSYSDAIPKGEHTSVAYRVRAYDAFNEVSGYTTSPTRTISNNTAPLIQCDLSGDLGDKSEGFTIPYTVTDAENHAVTVTEKVGGMVKRSNHSVTLGQPNTFQITGAYFQKVRNGKQTAEIIATDAEGKSSTLSLTFTKKVHRASIMLSEPLAVEKEIKVCIIKVLGDIPADATFKVEVANNAGDDAPAWEDATDASKRGINYVFKNKTQVNGWKFGFRVTAERGKSGNGGYITSVQGGFQ